jgi:hypothetical protein
MTDDTQPKDILSSQHLFIQLTRLLLYRNADLEYVEPAYAVLCHQWVQEPASQSIGDGQFNEAEDVTPQYEDDNNEQKLGYRRCPSDRPLRSYRVAGALSSAVLTAVAMHCSERSSRRDLYSWIAVCTLIPDGRCL